MKIRKDLTGLKFGRYTVLRASHRNKWGTLHWWCRCECGTERQIAQYPLTNGDTKSCGCLRKDRIPTLVVAAQVANRLPVQLRNTHKLFSQFQTQAKTRNLGFSLTKAEVWELSQQNCFYCGQEPSNKVTFNSGDWCLYNGIDRVDNTQGYISENCVPCCIVCNGAKCTQTVDEFLAWLKRAYEGCYGKAEL